MVSRDTPASLARWLAVRRATIIDGSSQKKKFCRRRRTRVCSDKTRLLSRQKHALLLSRQNYVCRAKTLSRQIFVAGNTCLSRQNTASVVTKLRKCHFCRGKTNTCLSRQILAATNIILSRQNFCSVKHTFVAPKKCFVVTKKEEDTCGSTSQ